MLEDASVKMNGRLPEQRRLGDFPPADFANELSAHRYRSISLALFERPADYVTSAPAPQSGPVFAGLVRELPLVSSRLSLCLATPSNTRSLHGWSRAAHGHEGATPREIRRAPLPNTPTNLPVGNDRAFLARRSVSLRLVEKAGYRRHRGALATQW